MSRKQKILRHINKNGCGVEIGPSYNPIASKKEGFNVHVIDHMDTEQLIERFKTSDVDISLIEEVDFVWKGEAYSKLTGNTKYYDWIIASHVIEHTPDLIGFINNCDEILKENGVISLAIPDKRYCFDCYRPITGIAKIIDAHYSKAEKHTPGTVAEYFINAVSRSGKIAWDSSSSGGYNLLHTLDEVSHFIDTAVNESGYLDVHSWCFVPHSFRLLIQDLYCLGLIPYKEVDFSITEGFEFFITLGRAGQGVDKSRLELLEIIESELTDFIDIDSKNCSSYRMDKYSAIHCVNHLLQDIRQKLKFKRKC